LIDFTEIENGDVFEDFVFELLKNRPDVKNLKKTGTGSDFGADLTFTLVYPEELLESVKEYKTIVECKHKSVSGRSVTKSEVDIFRSLHNYGATVYILITSTRVGASLSKSFNIDPNNSEFNHKRLKYYDRSYLERELMKPKNRDIFIRYLPLSYNKVEKAFETENKDFNKLRIGIEKLFNEGLPQAKKKRLTMKSIYIIRNSIDDNIFQEGRLKKIAKENNITLFSSLDVVEDWIFSFDKIINYKKFLETSDSLFGIVTSKSSNSPQIWIEIERARSTGKLKVLFIEEEVYSIFLHSQYPCIIIKDNLEDTISDFQNYFRLVAQDSNYQDNSIFWFSLEIVLSIFSSKANKGIHAEN
jgi:hypothetical protein